MMSHHRFLLLLILGFFLLSWKADAQDRQTIQHQDAVFARIDKAYQDGELNLDQKVLYKFYVMRNPSKLPAGFKSDKKLLTKCGTPAFSDFRRHREQLSESVIAEIEMMRQHSAVQSSETYQSPSGNFTIHYETTGEDAVPPDDQNNNNVPDYVEETAAAADSSYKHEVQTLGYSDPIPSGNRIDVFIRDLATETFTTYGQSNGTDIVIENDFSEGFPPNDDPEGNQIGAIKVTIAHELKHVIQYEASQWQGEIERWLEMDAVLMEEVVYDNVNDYYNYIQTAQSIFSNPQNSFYPSDGASYYIVSWALYFEERYGSQFWVDIWEIIKANPSITMIDAITQQLGGTEAFERNFTTSHLWHYASGDHATAAYGFEESSEYPTPKQNFNFVGDDSLAEVDTINTFSANYFNIESSPFSGSVAINVTDLSVPRAGFGILAYFKDGSVEPIILQNSQKESFNYRSDWQWEEIQKIGIVAANNSRQQFSKYGLSVRSFDPQIVEVEQNYPNPFSEQTTIRYTLPEQKNIRLEVFDILGRKVATLVNETQPKGVYPETFNAEGLASGVYFYRIIIDGEVTTKKMTLIK